MYSRAQFSFRAGMAIIILLTAPQTARPDQNKCNPSGLERMIGKPYSEEVAEEARRASGAATSRPMGPGIPSSADFRDDRLNVLVDKGRVILGFRCG